MYWKTSHCPLMSNDLPYNSKSFYSFINELRSFTHMLQTLARYISSFKINKMTQILRASKDRSSPPPLPSKFGNREPSEMGLIPSINYRILLLLALLPSFPETFPVFTLISALLHTTSFLQYLTSLSSPKLRCYNIRHV